MALVTASYKKGPKAYILLGPQLIMPALTMGKTIQVLEAIFKVTDATVVNEKRENLILIHHFTVSQQ